jgi:hypothetical protein
MRAFIFITYCFVKNNIMCKFLLGMAILLNLAGITQTAPNFTCNDCSGNNHDLFTELDAGKVIVICWVEPCGGCVDPSLITAYIVENYQNSFPEKVYMYLVDDYANTDCSPLISWANMFGIHPTAFFSDETIDMMDYGSTGMPKVVVIGSSNHDIFYNANNLVDSAALSQAINDAIVATTTGLNNNKGFEKDYLFPNPSDNKVFLLVDPGVSGNIQVQITNLTGNILLNKTWTSLSNGKNKLEIDTQVLKNGFYLIELNDGIRIRKTKMMVQH